METMDLEDATSELYALTPAGFTARRTELVAQARQERAKDLAKEISELRRPTVSAWLVNQMVRGAGGAEQEIEELEELGADLRAAQAELDGPRMKELAKQRQKLVAALLRRADAIGEEDGQKVSAGTRRELEETFGAAIADEQASLAVTSGRLTRALVYAGFGEVDVTAATATPVTKRRHLTSAPKHRPGEPLRPVSTDGTTADTAEPERDAAAAARKAAAEAAEIARADEAAALEDLEAAAQRRNDIRAEETRLSETLEELQREIIRVRHELDGLARSLAAAERDHQRRERQLDQARKVLRQNEQALHELP